MDKTIAIVAAAAVVALAVYYAKQHKKLGFQPDTYGWPGPGVDVTADAFPYGNYSGVMMNYPQL